jgi:hypothetical protein
MFIETETSLVLQNLDFSDSVFLILYSVAFTRIPFEWLENSGAYML